MLSTESFVSTVTATTQISVSFSCFSKAYCAVLSMCLTGVYLHTRKLSSEIGRISENEYAWFRGAMILRMSIFPYPCCCYRVLNRMPYLKCYFMYVFQNIFPLKVDLLPFMFRIQKNIMEQGYKIIPMNLIRL